MANVSSSNGIEKYPKLRFPEFAEPWSHVKLSDFAERIMRKNKNNETDLPLTISSKDGLVDQISFFNKTVASKDMSGYYLLLNGEYAYNKSYSVGYDFGSIKRLERYPMGALSTLYICFALKKYNSDFIKTYFDSLKWYKEIYMISAEGARNHGLLNVPTDEFFDTYHYITENEVEQEKIAKLMELIDRRIQKHQALVDNLKKYKRGVSKRFFDAIHNDQTCTVKQFSEVFELLQNNTFSRECLTDENTEVLNVHYGDILVKYGSVVDPDVDPVPFIKKGNDVSKYSDSSYLQDGDVIFADTAEDYTVGKMCEIINVSNRKILSGLHTMPFRPNTAFAPMYLGYYLNSAAFRAQILPVIQGAKVSSISKSEMKKTVMHIPSVERQRELVSILNALDKRIKRTELALDRLKEMKKGLLQNLFI